MGVEGHQLTEDKTGGSLEDEERRSPGSSLLPVVQLSDSRGGSMTDSSVDLNKTEPQTRRQTVLRDVRTYCWFKIPQSLLIIKHLNITSFTLQLCVLKFEILKSCVDLVKSPRVKHLRNYLVDQLSCLINKSHFQQILLYINKLM